MDRSEFLALATIHAPEPSKEIINMHARMDQQRNPHNDSYKPRRRTENEIIAQLKVEYGLTLLEAFSRHINDTKV